MIKRHRLPLYGLVLVGFSILGWLTVANRSLPDASASSKVTVVFPEPPREASATQQPQVAVLAGGCFWGVEGVFEHTKGVMDVVSGYAGGKAQDANYERVGTGQTGHAEAVQITYDPAQISYGQLLKIYFSVAHDPTQLNQQGPDQGPQYRSTIFFTTPVQRQIAQDYIQKLNTARVFPQVIATTLEPLEQFYAAEGYHQDFMVRNPNYPYVVVHDLPKIKALQTQWPQLYTTRLGTISTK